MVPYQLRQRDDAGEKQNCAEYAGPKGNQEYDVDVIGGVTKAPRREKTQQRQIK